ncbi:MAG: hypothetical protein PHC92_08220 [Syntrophomonadaceae bacterium]|nr:hypothetical protein [Syntrophomonadaceae bacterium]MDD3024224.1 hypothetical protein [Syntrophomonadaceae bacterium]
MSKKRRRLEKPPFFCVITKGVNEAGVTIQSGLTDIQQLEAMAQELAASAHRLPQLV